METQCCEHVCLDVEEESVRIHLPDGTAVQQPLDVVFRSTLLRDALSDSTSGDTVTVSLPNGTLELWLAGLQSLELEDADLNVAAELPIRSGTLGPQAPDARVPAKILLQSLQAADFLDDRDAVERLRKRASYMLFAPWIKSSESSVDADLATGMLELPTTLQLSILAEAEVPFPLQLDMLPEGLQGAALHAAFPSISHLSSLSVPHGYLTSAQADVFFQALGKESVLQTALTSLDISRIPLGETTFSSLNPALEQLCSLRYLNMSQCRLDESSSAQLAVFISTCTALRTFLCAGNLGFPSLIRSLRQCLDLEHLELPNLAAPGFVKPTGFEKSDLISRWDGSGDIHEIDMNACGGLRLAAPDIAEMQCLCTLHLPRCKVSAEDLQALAGHISSLTTLQELYIYNPDLGKGGAAAMTSMLCSLPGLEGLHMYEEHTRSAAIELASFLPALTSLLHITFSGFQLGSESVEALASCLYGLTNLRTLVLESCGLGPAGAEALGQPLLQLTSLTNLNLENNGVGDEGIIALAGGIGKQSGLQILRLSLNCFSEAGAAAIASQFSALLDLRELQMSHAGTSNFSVALTPQLGLLTSLRKLSLVLVYMEGQAFEVVAKAISKLSLLQHLDMSACMLTSRAVETLALHMRGFSALQYLKLRCNMIGDDGVRALVPLVECNPSLTVVLDDNAISRECAADLAEVPLVCAAMVGLTSQTV